MKGLENLATQVVRLAIEDIREYKTAEREGKVTLKLKRRYNSAVDAILHPERNPLVGLGMQGVSPERLLALEEQ